MPRHALLLAALLGLPCLLWIACPEDGDDDDDDDTTAGDDDTSGDDDVGDDDDDTGDDDTGDDDTGDDDMGDGGGTWTIADATDCGPLRSAIYYDHWKDPWPGIHASSEPLTCGDYAAAAAALDAADDVLSAAYSAAEKAQDGAAACDAYVAYYTVAEAQYSIVQPPGSCTLSMYPSDWVDGAYDVVLEAAPYLALYGWYVVRVESDYTAYLAYLAKACPGVTSWADWMTVLMDIWDHGGSYEHWDLTSGTVMFTNGAELSVATKAPISIESYQLKADGTLDFDLSVAHCGK